MDFKEYVLGFAFDEHKDSKNVALIKKERPDYQKGLLNGIGGKIEPYDISIKDAMVREFKEETGVLTTIDDWNHIVTINDDSYNLYIYSSILSYSKFNNIKTTEDEEIIKLNIWDVHYYNRMPNIDWLIPLCLHDNGIEFPIVLKGY